MRVRHLLFVTTGMIGAALGGAAISSAITDPDVDVDAVPMPGINSTRTAAAPGSGISSASDPAGPGDEGVVVQTVDGLELLTGTLRAGEDPDDWYVSGIEVNFGPDGWISGAPSFGDYDGDGTDEPLLAELDGLEGRNLTLGVHYTVDDDRDDADAFTIEGRAFRDPTGGQAPWQIATTGIEVSREDAAAAAVGAVGEGAVPIAVDRESEDGWIGWDVDVRAADGQEYQVYVDLDGEVLDVRPDTD